MTLDETPRVRRSKKSSKRRGSRKARRVTKVIGWSVLGLVTAAMFFTGAIYLVLNMRGAGN